MDGDNLKLFIKANANGLKTFYVSICMLRCLTLIPATPFIVSGILLFPQEPAFVLIVSMISVLGAATVHFYFSRYLEFDNILEKRFGKYFLKAREQMKKNGILYTFLWTIMPFLPSDVMYYIAGVSGMKFLQFLCAVGVGAFIILWVYIYLGAEFIESLF